MLVVEMIVRPSYENGVRQVIFPDDRRRHTTYDIFLYNMICVYACLFLEMSLSLSLYVYIYIYIYIAIRVLCWGDSPWQSPASGRGRRAAPRERGSCGWRPRSSRCTCPANLCPNNSNNDNNNNNNNDNNNTNDDNTELVRPISVRTKIMDFSGFDSVRI